ncbi:uncharacterized protein [Procambarus clarkii]|uniref:uncharacterized protein n=1 Tax=Procambarus clarkii TaxID=6728 RepID=UPI003743BBBE
MADTGDCWQDGPVDYRSFQVNGWYFYPVNPGNTSAQDGEGPRIMYCVNLPGGVLAYVPNGFAARLVPMYTGGSSSSCGGPDGAYCGSLSGWMPQLNGLYPLGMANYEDNPQVGSMNSNGMSSSCTPSYEVRNGVTYFNNFGCNTNCPASNLGPMAFNTPFDLNSNYLESNCRNMCTDVCEAYMKMPADTTADYATNGFANITEIDTLIFEDKDACSTGIVEAKPMNGNFTIVPNFDNGTCTDVQNVITEVTPNIIKASPNSCIIIAPKSTIVPAATSIVSDANNNITSDFKTVAINMPKNTSAVPEDGTSAGPEDSTSARNLTSTGDSASSTINSSNATSGRPLRWKSKFAPRKRNQMVDGERRGTTCQTLCPPPPAPPTNSAINNVADHTRLQKNPVNKPTQGNFYRRPPRCVFCRKNGEEDYFHSLKDRRGRVMCPVLSSYKCRLCGATGIHAHTLKYCPRNMLTKGDPVAAGFPPGLMPPQYMLQNFM